MCGKFNLTSSIEQLAKLFSMDISDEISKTYRPSEPATPGSAVIGISSERYGDDLQFRYYRWGLTPKWSVENPGTNYLFNTRSETIINKHTFRSAFQSRRVIIPADNFWEWSSVKDTDPRYRHDREPSSKYTAETLFDLAGEINKDYRPHTKKRKQAFSCYRNDLMPFALAAIFEISAITGGGLAADVSLPADRDKDLYTVKKDNDAFLYSCSIITTAANNDMAAIHNRQPAILEKKDWSCWLDHKSSPKELIELLRPTQTGIFRCSKAG